MPLAVVQRLSKEFLPAGVLHIGNTRRESVVGETGPASAVLPETIRRPFASNAELPRPPLK